MNHVATVAIVCPTDICQPDAMSQSLNDYDHIILEWFSSVEGATTYTGSCDVCGRKFTLVVTV